MNCDDGVGSGRHHVCLTMWGSFQEGDTLAQKELMDKMSIYIPQPKIGMKPVERLIALGKKRDRSVNYLVVEAILQYVDREEKKPG